LVLTSSILVFGGLDVVVKDGKVLPDSSLGESGGIRPVAYLSYLYVQYYSYFYTTINATHINASGTMTCYALSYTISDPAGILYEQQTRQEIIGLVKGAIPPDKQSGALLFFNKDTKRLETYVPGEGKFYDLQGNLIYTMTTIDVATEYKTLYYLDIMTGEVKERQEVVVDTYVIKKGFRLDGETGHFINVASGEIVPKETAVEIISG
jgi:hypothetical protein